MTDEGTLNVTVLFIHRNTCNNNWVHICVKNSALKPLSRVMSSQNGEISLASSSRNQAPSQRAILKTLSVQYWETGNGPWDEDIMTTSLTTSNLEWMATPTIYTHAYMSCKLKVKNAPKRFVSGPIKKGILFLSLVRHIQLHHFSAIYLWM